MKRRKSFAARAYRLAGDTVEPILPPSLRTPAHHLSRRLTRRHEAEYHTLMEMVRPGRTAVDAGANIGIFTYGFLARGANVVAIEPQRRCADQIRAFYARGFPLLSKPRRGHLDVRVEALADKAGTAVLHVPLRDGRIDDESASLGPQGGESIRVEVPVARLDDYGLDDVAVLKMDVEGREVAALEGGAGTIRRWKPAILVEIEQRHHGGPIADVFAEVARIIGTGYRGSFLRDGGEMHPLKDFDVERDQLSLADNPLSRAYVRNFFFIA